ncbi:MAG: transketolase family protein [Candidatus Micrarchaeia archaeon]
MKKAFFSCLEKLAEKDSSITLLTGDLGFSVLEKFKEKFPKRFYNAGIAEQSMIGISAGLALCNKKPFVYSIIPFLTMRCFEQVRVDLAQQNLPVRLVGTGGGFSYGLDGVTHHATEDLAIMRVLPNMTVACPADPFEAVQALEKSQEIRGPVYFRLSENSRDLYEHSSFEFGRATCVREGSNATVFCTGPVLENVLKAASFLKKEKGISIAVYSVHCIKPLDEKAVLTAAEKGVPVFSVEEHSKTGGLGSAISEVLSPFECKPAHFILGLPDAFQKTVGSRDFLISKAGLSAQRLAQEMFLRILKGKRNRIKFSKR